MMPRLFVETVATLLIFGMWTNSAASIEVSRSLGIAAPPAAVWAIIGDFCAIERWHPQVERCIQSNDQDAEGETAMIRGLTIAGGLGTVVEVETTRNEKGMSYSYAFIQGPLPVKAYNATIAVTPDGENSTVVWTATFDAAGMSEADAKADIEGVYDQGLAGIAKQLSR